ncbi:aldehyde-activating protein [Kosakonia sp. H7A]|uniref:GFA family protein n=1 Tax=Kosakonia sp. H7A TaxID=2054598 RepID=UPI000D15D907|nr:aldehyde-activating protein [Kosakonia sp. H7A]
MAVQADLLELFTGGCFCGSVRYQVAGKPLAVAVCHCKDCQRSAGAPMVSWSLYAQSSLVIIKGKPATFSKSGAAIRSFCPVCGSGLFYTNSLSIPGRVDVQSSTFDCPEAFPPQAQVQVAERLDWVNHLLELPGYERYPGPDKIP